MNAVGLKHACLPTSLAVMKAAGLIAISVWLAGCVSSEIVGSVSESNPAPEFRAVSVIRDNGGGDLTAYALRAKRMTRDGRRIKFAGRCNSACTLFLSLPRENMCIEPGATFGFHTPTSRSDRNARTAAGFMIRSYPGWVRSWIRTNGGLGDQIKTMGYDYASRHIRSCPPNNLRRAVKAAIRGGSAAPG